MIQVAINQKNPDIFQVVTNHTTKRFYCPLICANPSDPYLLTRFLLPLLFNVLLTVSEKKQIDVILYLYCQH